MLFVKILDPLSPPVAPFWELKLLDISSPEVGRLLLELLALLLLAMLLVVLLLEIKLRLKILEAEGGGLLLVVL